MLDDMYVKCIRVAPTPFRRDWYGRLHAKLTVLNAEGVYRVLKEEQLEPRRLERLAAARAERDFRYERALFRCGLGLGLELAGSGRLPG